MIMTMVRPNDGERLCGRLEFHRLLDEGIKSMENRDCQPAEEAFAELEEIFKNEETLN